MPGYPRVQCPCHPAAGEDSRAIFARAAKAAGGREAQEGTGMFYNQVKRLEIRAILSNLVQPSLVSRPSSLSSREAHRWARELWRGGGKVPPAPTSRVCRADAIVAPPAEPCKSEILNAPQPNPDQPRVRLSLRHCGHREFETGKSRRRRLDYCAVSAWRESHAYLSGQLRRSVGAHSYK